MSENYRIMDMTIAFEYHPTRGCICHVVLDSLNRTFSFYDQAHEIRAMCTYMNNTYPPRQIYKEVIYKLYSFGQIGDDIMVMYDEYFGSETWSSSTTTTTISSKKIKDREVELSKQRDSVREAEDKRINLTKLGITFWGCLIIQDMI